MKKRYFKFVEIDKDIVSLFLAQHPDMKRFINDQPFYVRVGLKPYPSLIHHVISQDVDSTISSKIAIKLEETIGKITPRKVNKLTDQQLLEITNDKVKAQLIREITNDIISKKLKLKRLVNSDTQTIIKQLSYPNLSLNTIKQFALFGCFKQDVLCDTDPDFIDGLKIYLNKKDITKQDIINIESEYKSQLTLFSLCMWRIKNERK